MLFFYEVIFYPAKLSTLCNWLTVSSVHLSSSLSSFLCKLQRCGGLIRSGFLYFGKMKSQMELCPLVAPHVAHACLSTLLVLILISGFSGASLIHLL
jgi:hypothetical protein